MAVAAQIGLAAIIGTAEDVLSNQLFAVIVGMSVLTTVLAPPLLRALAQRPPQTSDPASV